MAHIEKIRQIALSFPHTSESPHFDKTSFRVKKKIFATWDEPHARLAVKLSPTDQQVFSAIPGAGIAPVPNKWGTQGWTYVFPDQIKDELLEDVLKVSYSTVSQ